MNKPVWIFDGSDGRGDVLVQLVTQYADAMDQIGGTEGDLDPIQRLEAEFRGQAHDLVLHPRIERLFPPALDDAQEAAEFRRHTLGQQAADRLLAARTVLDAVCDSETPEVPVADHEVDDWVKTLSGLRATWHVELTGSTERMADATTAHVAANPQVAAVCDWLGYLVEEALQSRALYRGGGE